MAEPPVAFATVLRKLRTQARLTQEELAEAADLSPRSVSDLERGIAATPRRETVRLLADALGLAGPARAEFEAAARAPCPPQLCPPKPCLPKAGRAWTGWPRCGPCPGTSPRSPDGNKSCSNSWTRW